MIKRNLLIVGVMLSSCITSGCSLEDMNVSGNELLKGMFTSNEAKWAEDKKLDISKPLYSEKLQDMAEIELEETKLRFEKQLYPYRAMVDQLWATEGFYRNQEAKISPKETLIDFYLFMEYHQDTQLRNLHFPKNVSKELLIVEALFAEKAIDYLESLDLGEHYTYLQNDLLTHYKNMYKEELVNILYEGLNQLDLTVRVPNIINRYEAIFDNNGLLDRVKIQLGIPDSVISRGMGLDLVTLYGGTGDFTPDDVKKLALLLTIEMKISGANMKLEKFFHVTNSIDGLGDDLISLRKDVELINTTGELSWVKTRMGRSIDYLDKIYKFYNGNSEHLTVNDIFIELQVREDFYALGLLSEHIKEVMDNEEYWTELEKLKGTYEVIIKEEEY